MNGEQQSFRATAYHPDLGNEIAEGGITFDTWSLKFASETVPLDFPYQGLRIDFGEMKSGLLRFTHPTKPGWSINTTDLSILEHRVFLQKFELKKQLERGLERSGHNWHKLLKQTVGVFAGFMAFAFLLVWLSGFIVQFLVGQVPLSYDKKLGESVLEDVKAEERFIEDPPKIAYLEKVAARLLPSNVNTNLQFRFYIVDDQMPNAFALPGGAIIVNSGLLDFVESPEELAGILAHEIAHVTERHGVRKLISSAGPYAALRLFLQNENSFLSLIGAGSSFLLSQNFSQQYENEADDAGWKLLVAGKIDPRGLTENLKRIRQEMKSIEDEELTAFSSHPPTIKRVQRLEKKWQTLKTKTAFVPLEEIPFAQEKEKARAFRSTLYNFNQPKAR